MDLEQFVADSLENTSVARYRALFSGGNRGLVRVECGTCGAIQTERLRAGARWIEMECRRCGLRTRRDMTGGAEGEPGRELGSCWFDGLEPLDDAGG